MKKLLPVAFLFCIVAACTQDKIHGILYQTITVDTKERAYILYLPEKLVKNAPLVFVCHGYTDNATNMMNETGMNAIADRAGFAVCYPQGLKDTSGNTFWEVGYSFTESLGINDVKFLTTLASHLQEKYHLSKEYTFATGMSNGADMCIMVACKAPAYFKAIAPVCGSLMKVVYDSCKSALPISVFMINSTADDITWWDGDMVNKQGYGPYLPTLETFNFFVAKNECRNAMASTLPDTYTRDSSYVMYEKHINTETGNQVWLYKVVNGKHHWPGASGNMDINATAEVWSFFSQFIAE